MKIWPADKWFSLCIRERSNWTCEVCGTGYPPNSRGLECSHYVGRANKATRWDPDNCWSKCTKCHFRLGGNPAEFTRWVQSKIGIEAEEALYRKGNTVLHLTKRDRDGIAAHYKTEYEKMRRLRDDGETGRIEFQDWDLSAG